MGAPERPRTGPLPFDTGPIAEIVPARAVLTELARGFLLSQSADPERAKRFAATFLREQQARPSPAVGPYRLLPTPRGSFAAPLRGREDRRTR